MYCDQGARQLGTVPTTRRRGARRAGCRRTGRAGARGERGCDKRCDTAMLACDTAEGPAATRPQLLRPGASARCARLGVLVSRLGMLARSVGLVWVFGAPDSL